MRKVVLSLSATLVVVLLITLHLRGRSENEGESEAPITASSKSKPRQGMTPILELPAESETAAGISIQQVYFKNGVAQVPSSAIIREQNRVWIYLKLAGGQYARLEIEPVTNTEEGAWRALGNAPSKAAVVTVGAQLLLSEELKSEFQMDEGGA